MDFQFSIKNKKNKKKDMAIGFKIATTLLEQGLFYRTVPLYP